MKAKLASAAWIAALVLLLPQQAQAQGAVSFRACSLEERGRQSGGKLLVPQDLYQTTIDAAKRNGLPWQMLLSLIWQESTYCQKVVSPAGALGLGQLMPGTAAAMGIDPRDPYQNIEGSARYLRQMALRYRDWPLALAAYNAGPSNVDRCSCWNPFPETEQHVRLIVERYNGLIAGSP